MAPVDPTYFKAALEVLGLATIDPGSLVPALVAAADHLATIPGSPSAKDALRALALAVYDAR